jgi:hypothetical protein
MVEDKYWMGPVPKQCDICQRPITDTFVDGAIKLGPWGVMGLCCFEKWGRGLGTGRGQKYVKQENGHFKKVEG